MLRASLVLAALGGLSSAAPALAQLALVPTGDNRGGATNADANTLAFPEVVTNGYNVDPSEAYKFINDLQYPATLTEGARTASANIRTTSQFVGLNASRSRISGVRFRTQGTASISATTAAGASLVSTQESIAMGFRVDSVPTGGAAYRFIGSAAGSGGTAGLGVPVVSPVELRRNGVVIASVASGQSANRVVRISQTGEYELRGGYTFNRTLAGSGTYSAQASVSGALVCVADFDGNGATDLTDIFAFLDAWFQNNLSADANGGGAVELLDIFAFLERWFAGCA